jgi:hypothetical protein
VGGWVGVSGCEWAMCTDRHAHGSPRVQQNALALVSTLFWQRNWLPFQSRFVAIVINYSVRIQKAATDAMKPRACLATTSAASTTPTACSGCLSGGRCTHER